MGKDFRSRRRGKATANDASTSVAMASPLVSSPTSVAVNAGVPTDEFFRLPQIGPVASTQVSFGGSVYRNNYMADSNLDAVQVILRAWKIDISGSAKFNSAIDPAGSALAYLNARFWPDVYVMLHDMAQKRDGYKSQDGALTVPLLAKHRDNLILTAKINVRVLWALFHCTLYNEGMKTMIPGLQRLRRRLLEALKWTNQLVYPAAWDTLIDYWSQVYVPYPGGPVVANIFDFQHIAAVAAIAPTGSTFHAWGSAMPDFTSYTSLGYMIDDINLACAMIDRYAYLNVAASVTDLKLLTSMYKMMSFPTPQTGVSGIKVDPQRWTEQFKGGAFSFIDDKGGGTDTFVTSRDVKGDVEGLLDIPDYGYPHGELEALGFLTPYGHDLQDSATPGYCATSEKVLSLGLVSPTALASAGAYDVAQINSFWTREDGWIAQPTTVDITSASGMQALLWQYPVVTLHPEHWVMIRSEESEEEYRMNIESGSGRFQTPWDHFAQRYHEWLHAAYQIPYIR